MMTEEQKEYSVQMSRKVQKGLRKLPERVRDKFYILAEQLRWSGPIASNWPNYSKLGKEEYHCHLFRSWVAVWRNESETIVIEVKYVGSRENAPY